MLFVTVAPWGIPFFQNSPPANKVGTHWPTPSAIRHCLPSFLTADNVGMYVAAQDIVGDQNDSHRQQCPP